MPATVVVGGFFGDEGKGKVISYLVHNDTPRAVVRGGVGPNAGHTVVYEGRTFKLRMLPSAITSKDTKLMVGAGVLVNPKVLLDEIQRFDVSDRVLVDHQCGIIEDSHLEKDSGGHLKSKIGTTGSGTGPANSDRVMRVGKVARDIPELAKYIGDVSHEVNLIINNGGMLLVEGTQGTFLSLYHGTYPFVTSKDVTASAICSDIGLGPRKVDEVIVVFKSYITRVGGGMPLRGELPDEEAARRGWREVATVTGRVRRSAPFDFDLAKKAVELNSATQIAITKLDAIYPKDAGKTNFDDLSEGSKEFLRKVEGETEVPVTIIGTGPEVFQIVDRR